MSFFLKKDASPAERALWGDLLSLGFVIPMCILLGMWAGQWIGGWLGHRVTGRWIGLAFGVASAFWELMKLARRAERLDPPPEPPDPSSHPDNAQKDESRHGHP